MDYEKEFDQLLESHNYNNINMRKRKVREANEVSNLKTIDQAITLQATIIKKAK